MRVILILLSVFFISCKGQEGNSYKNGLDELIPVDLHSNLPEQIGPYSYELAFELKPEFNQFVSNVVTVYLSYNVDNTHMDSLLQEMRSSSIAKYSFNDNCNVVIYHHQEDEGKTSYIGREWIYNEWIEKLDTCSEKKIPIPNFIDAGEGEFKHKQGISSDYTLYVTEAKSGKHFNEKYYADEIIMPKGWERGYSQGYALNEKENKVIYWFVIW